MQGRKKTRKYCITVSGYHGSGTSTASAGVAKALGLRVVSAGDIFRHVAEVEGIPIADFNGILERSTEMREQLDNQLAAEAKKGNVVICGRLAGWKAGANADLRVALVAPYELRVKRIAQRDRKSHEEADAETKSREQQERDAFLKMYCIDVEDLSVYDLVINTATFDVTATVSLIVKAFESLAE